MWLLVMREIHRGGLNFNGKDRAIQDYGDKDGTCDEVLRVWDDMLQPQRFRSILRIRGI